MVQLKTKSSFPPIDSQKCAETRPGYTRAPLKREDFNLI